MLFLYNTLTGLKEEFKSIKPKAVGMYVCGPTVYDYAHIGHGRTYLIFDLLNRFLRHLNYKVTYIQNITDVGHLVNNSDSGADKVKQKAQESDQTPGDIVRHYTETHLRDLASLNILTPTNFPKASDHVQEIIKYVSELIGKGFAYVTADNNVYFSVSKKSDYGKLSRRGVAEILTGTRIEPSKDKRSPADFALWKAAPYGHTEMTWESPWGRGFPGWHIECSVMSQKYLGETFDIHGSGVDNVFPHHENEIAQAEAHSGKPLANYWVHSGTLTFNGQKMSKSLHNTVSISEALKLYSANEIRLAIYQTYYRKPFDYTKKSMEQGVALRQKLFAANTNLPEKTNPEVFEQIIEALQDDLDTTKALSIWANSVNRLSRDDTEKLFEIFGLNYRPIEDDERAHQLATDRNQARERKDFLTADNRRAEIEQLGYDVVDADGQTDYIPR